MCDLVSQGADQLSRLLAGEFDFVAGMLIVACDFVQCLVDLLPLSFRQFIDIREVALELLGLLWCQVFVFGQKLVAFCLDGLAALVEYALCAVCFSFNYVVFTAGNLVSAIVAWTLGYFGALFDNLALPVSDGGFYAA